MNQVGTVTFDDIDDHDVIDITASYNGNIAWSHGSLTAATISALTTGTFVSSVTDAAAPGTTPWTYVANDVDLDFLNAGESITLSFTVTATDSHGATSTDSVTIVINGTAEVRVDAPAAPGFTQQETESVPDLDQSSIFSYYLMTSAT